MTIEKIVKLHTFGYCLPSWIFGRRWCRPLSVAVVNMRLALWPYFGFGTPFLSTAITKL